MVDSLTTNGPTYILEDLFKISLGPSMYMLKSLGDRMPPWRTPLVH